MAMVTGILWVVLFGMVLIGIGLIVAQIFLSRAESKWFGLILPILSFLGSLVLVLNAADQGGAVSGFLVGNIGTVLYLVIYAVIRGKKKKNKQLDQMKIKDL